MVRPNVWWIATGVAGCTLGLSGSTPRVPSRPAVAPASVNAARVRDLDIEFYRARVARDPLGAADLAQLAGLYLQRARESGSNEDLLRAEAAAARSAAHRVNRNSYALQVLASSQLGQHKFAEARQTAERLTALDPGRPSYRALLGEVDLELGRYDEARTTFATLVGNAGDLSVAPRMARWLEIQGRTEAAHHLLLLSRSRAAAAYGASKEQIAWFDLRVGDLALRNGRLDEAETAFRQGLRAFPGDYRLLAALSRLAACRHRWQEAIDYGSAAVAIALDPATLGVVGDAYRELGDSARAEEYYRAMEVAVLGQPGSYHRAWSLFLLDHDRQISQVLAEVERELETRRDIYGYDLLAWALYKSGRIPEAAQAIHRALGQGTRDAQLYFHAGMIARAAGDDRAAGESLRAALEINPYFDPFRPAAAKAVLDSLTKAGEA